MKKLVEFNLTDKNKKFDKDDILEEEFVTSIANLNNKDCFTVARIRNFNYCVELHYNSGIPFIEYGERIDYDCWKNETFSADWFNINMSESEVFNKLFELFEEYKNNEYNTSFLNEEYIFN